MNRATWQQTLGESSFITRPPADPAVLTAAEGRLGVALPDGLRTLYEVTDGILDPEGHGYVIWRLEDLVSRNLDVWTGSYGGPPDSLLAFGDDGAGAPFCVDLAGDPAVYVWNNIDQQTWPLALTLPSFWRGWAAGIIST